MEAETTNATNTPGLRFLKVRKCRELQPEFPLPKPAVIAEGSATTIRQSPAFAHHCQPDCWTFLCR
jgi:hypothetical protein